MRILALKVRQPLGEFYLTTLPAKFFVDRVRNRPRTSSSSQSEDIQRIFSKTRVQNIADFTTDPQATFPTPIILGVDSSVITEANVEVDIDGAASNVILLDIPDEGIVGDVLDGQHRVLGLRQSAVRSEFDLAVVLMFDLSLDDKAFVFSTINSKQTPVSSSLIYDLFGLSTSRSPQKTCNYIAQALNSSEGSPFYRKLKMLGRREDHHGDGKVMLSQGTFAARLEQLISRDSAEDVRILKTGKGSDLPDDKRCPLRKYFKNDDDATILKIVQNFFTAISKQFKAEWEDENGDYIIRKSVGYTALIIVLRHVLERGFKAKNLTEEFFSTEAAAMKTRMQDEPLTSANFPSNGAQAIRLAKCLLDVQELEYHVIEAPNVEDVRLDA